MFQRRWARVREGLGRVGRPSRSGRQTLALIGKSTLAAAASWYVAHDLLVAQTPAFGPFSAVLIMQVTLYQSLLQALRYMAAVCAGVIVQAALGFLAGPDLLTFVLVALIALAIGRWRRLGSQGTQVATAAFFAFSTYSASTGNQQRAEQLGQIVLLVAIGCTIGVVVNLLLWPPMRYRSAEAGIHTLAGDLSALLADIHPALREHGFDEDEAQRWRRRAADATSLVSQTRAALRAAVEGRYYNPRRFLPHNRRHKAFDGYREVIDALERVAHQTASLTRTLYQWPRNETGTDRDGFLRDYADLLEALADITDRFSVIDEEHLSDQAEELCEAATTAQDKRARLVERAEDTSLPLGDPSRPYGILLAEATRLTEEAQHSCDSLQHATANSSTAGG
ncbi:aromatic acid exporter family protein [Streptomyces tubbatahanensis]|uniref:Aromatic acid exporter family protein n=1 Tax=Streptomyces tubbatahanensis TaxID=2923272 RepID=A0ABY3Y0Y3_9ACTN|nr:FUSC family protein [Streptomyces tubbatahanensis]UNT00486.1 aromatic acid exporter family protein [Streptomyces tubbatahanensis]